MFCIYVSYIYCIRKSNPFSTSSPASSGERTASETARSEKRFSVETFKAVYFF